MPSSLCWKISLAPNTLSNAIWTLNKPNASSLQFLRPPHVSGCSANSSCDAPRRRNSKHLDVLFTSKHFSSCCFVKLWCSSLQHFTTLSLLVLTPFLAHNILRMKKEKKKNELFLPMWQRRDSNIHKSSNSFLKCTQWVKLFLTPPRDNPRV